MHSMWASDNEQGGGEQRQSQHERMRAAASWETQDALGRRASLVAPLEKIHLQCRRPWLDSWVGKIPWRRDRLPTPVFLGFPYGSAGEESACNAGDLGSFPGLGRCPGEGKGYPLQYSGLENSMDCKVHEVAKSWTQLSDFHFTSC